MQINDDYLRASAVKALLMRHVATDGNVVIDTVENVSMLFSSSSSVSSSSALSSTPSSSSSSSSLLSSYARNHVFSFLVHVLHVPETWVHEAAAYRCGSLHGNFPLTDISLSYRSSPLLELPVHVLSSVPP